MAGNPIVAQSADAIIIGGGVTGLSTALHLKAMGAARVIVLERHYTGAGQSGRAAGIIRALVAHPAVSSMLRESLEFFQTFEERFGEPVEVHPIGYLLLAEASDAERVRKAVEASASAGVRASRISREEALELQPGLRGDDGCIYAFEPGAVWTDPMPAVQAMSRAARRLGIKILEGCDVLRILHRMGKVSGVETSAGRFSAPQVMIGTAAWGATQLRALGLTVPVYPHRVEMAFFQRAPREPRNLVRVLSDSRSQLYLRPEGKDQMFAGWREGDLIQSTSDLKSADPDNYRQTADYSSLVEMHRRLAITLPFMATGFVHRTYACVYDYTPDGMPILDRAEGFEGLHFALGFSGGGFSLSPWVGRAMAESISTGKTPAPMELLACNRFQQNRPLDWGNASPVLQASEKV